MAIWYWFAVVLIPVEVVNPDILVPVVVYSIISPSLNPWLSNVIVLYWVEIPLGLTINFLLVNSPPSITSTPTTEVWLGKVTNLWIPEKIDVETIVEIWVPKPIVLIPEIESFLELYNLILLLSTTPAKYVELLINIPGVVPIPIPLPLSEDLYIICSAFSNPWSFVNVIWSVVVLIPPTDASEVRLPSKVIDLDFLTVTASKEAFPFPPVTLTDITFPTLKFCSSTSIFVIEPLRTGWINAVIPIPPETSIKGGLTTS